MESAILQGQKAAWNLLEKLGEGDAGEVFRVEGVLDQRPAILKRPRRSAFTNEVRRQAEQIRAEGRTLAALGILLKDLPGICTPQLLDQSRSGSEFSERFFIVIEQAPGFDLAWLARACRLGLEPRALDGLPAAPRAWLAQVVDGGVVPERILLATLSSLFTIFETIHLTRLPNSGEEAEGLIWNDVKAEHVFWDPRTATVSIIDWGNSRVLEGGGATRDLRHTAADDLRQLLEEMGRFLESATPGLHSTLAWPAGMPMPSDLADTVASLRERVASLLRDQNAAVIKAREMETEQLEPGEHPADAIDQLEEIQRRLVALGEMPDYPGALRLASRTVANLAAAGDLSAVAHVCSWAASLPDAPREQWSLLVQLATTANASARSDPVAFRSLSDAVRAATAGNWEGCLWAMLAFLASAPEPEGWNDLLVLVRRLAAGEETQSTRPLLTLRRAVLTLQTTAQQLEDQLARISDAADLEGPARLERMRDLQTRMREVALNWIQLDPLPPNSGLLYKDAELMIDEIEAALPGTGTALQKALAPARELVAAILEAWHRREFNTAGRLLRRLLPWDPDRRRLLLADQALQTAPEWLQRVRGGSPLGLQAYVTDLEYEGRELRNRIGPAGWIDCILEALKAIRNGAWPGDLLSAQPALLADMPWLQTYQRAEVVWRVLQPHLPPPPLPVISGIRETRFGPDTEIAFHEPLDAWIPEARGSSARVYLGSYRAAGGDIHEGAIKLMRIDKSDYALPLFQEEVQVLKTMRDVPGVNPLLECGFLWLGKDPLPPDQDLEAVRALRGEALRMGPDSSMEYLNLLEARLREGWTPYLIVEKRRHADNLLLLCDASLNRGNLRSPAELLYMAIQICDILVEAHRRNVVYRDHKILHYYWQPDTNGIYMIDWNVARYHPSGLSDLEIHMDLVQLGARGLHHILTGRTAPGALPLGPTRPEEIEQAAQSYHAQWTYDDRRLGDEVHAILEQLLSGAYTNAEDLRADLKRACLNLE